MALPDGFVDQSEALRLLVKQAFAAESDKQQLAYCTLHNLLLQWMCTHIPGWFKEISLNSRENKTWWQGETDRSHVQEWLRSWPVVVSCEQLVRLTAKPDAIQLYHEHKRPDVRAETLAQLLLAAVNVLHVAYDLSRYDCTRAYVVTPDMKVIAHTFDGISNDYEKGIMPSVWAARGYGQYFSYESDEVQLVSMFLFNYVLRPRWFSSLVQELTVTYPPLPPASSDNDFCGVLESVLCPNTFRLICVWNSEGGVAARKQLQQLKLDHCIPVLREHKVMPEDFKDLYDSV